MVWSRNERQLAASQQTPHCALRFWVVRGPKVCSSRAFDFVMIEDKSTGDSSFEEQGFKVFSTFFSSKMEDGASAMHSRSHHGVVVIADSKPVIELQPWTYNFSTD